ncbi:MAG: cytochrome c biogenesis protein CcmE, partial [Gammaproteobacteria bacterium]|nr:cytochrome c biogenesis protein CcmE [Gammaproteobacteria bacterium]
ADNSHQVTVAYSKILPDLFREGQGIIARGKLNESGVFMAEEVLAKHDENYMPPELAEALEGSGHPGSIASEQ